MPVHKRTDLKKLLKTITEHQSSPLFLCFGERYLCQKAADQLIAKLLERSKGAVHTIDGSTEDTGKILSRLLSFSLLPGRQIYRVADSTLFIDKESCSGIWAKALRAHQENRPERALRYLKQMTQAVSLVPENETILSTIEPEQWLNLFGFAHPGENISWADKLLEQSNDKPPAPGTVPLDRFLESLESGWPSSNILILLTEHLDKRKKLFTHLKQYGEIIDCTVSTGLSRAAVKEQKEVIEEMVRETLREFEKRIEPKALELLFERVGFHPVGVVMEVEKCAFFAENKSTITQQDVERLVARTREDALFQLTEALGNGNRSLSLRIFNNLSQNGIHPLAVIASLRNYLKRLLVFKSFQMLPEPIWQNNIDANRFQNDYLPALKNTNYDTQMLKGHPYALYMSFKKGAEFPIANLKRSLGLTLEAEYRLKSSPAPQSIVLEELLLSLIKTLKRNSKER